MLELETTLETTVPRNSSTHLVRQRSLDFSDSEDRRCSLSFFPWRPRYDYRPTILAGFLFTGDKKLKRVGNDRCGK